MAKTIVYRSARAGDLSNIHRLLQAEQKILALPYPFIDDNRLALYLANALNFGAIWVAELSGRVVGTLVCSGVTPGWSKVTLLINDFFVVDEHFRKHGVAVNLIKKAKAFSEEKRLPLWFEVSTGGKPELKDRFIQMQGLDYMGGRFLHWPSQLPTSPEDARRIEAENLAKARAEAQPL
jgi:GNAT superfamily N-acetyltransferase